MLRILDPKLGILRVKNLFPDDICEGMITITTQRNKIVLKQYENGDENRERSVVKSMDRRGRILIPIEILHRTGIHGMVQLECINEDTLYITKEKRPMCDDCPYRRLEFL